MPNSDLQWGMIMGLADRDYMRDRARSRARRDLPIYRSDSFKKPLFSQLRLLLIAGVAIAVITGLAQKLMTFAWIEALSIAASADHPSTSAAKRAAANVPAAIAHALYPIAAVALLFVGFELRKKRANSNFYTHIKNPDLCIIVGTLLGIGGTISLVGYYRSWERDNFAAPTKNASGSGTQSSARVSGGVEMYLPMQGKISRMLFKNNSGHDVAVTLRYTLPQNNLKKQAAKLYVGAGKIEHIDIPSYLYEVSIERFAADGRFSNPYGLNNMRSVTFRNPIDLLLPASSFSDYPLLTYDGSGELLVKAGRLNQLPTAPQF